MVSDPLLEPSSHFWPWYREVRAPGALALGSGRRGATVTPREQPDPPESTPRVAQLGWAGGQMDCAVAGMLGPTGARVAMGTGVAVRPCGRGSRWLDSVRAGGRVREGPAGSLPAPLLLLLLQLGDLDLEL